MKIGTYYYPEQWPREQWKRDFDNIAKMGLQIVHMAEFAWFQMEPEPGNIQLDWLDDCVTTATERGIKVILCTPTAAPPIWLARDFPDTLPIENGHVRDFGGRRHYSPTSPDYRAATVRIVTAMADRFGAHPNIIGWQIDNEYGQAFSTNDHTHAAFQDWLRKKYGSITELNHAWGCQFWNTYYTDFNQIRMPASRDGGYGNPHHQLDASRFWSFAFADYNRLQCDILRPKIGERFLTTNFMFMSPDANPADFRDDLSLVSWDSYPVTGWLKGAKDQTYRIAEPNGIGFVHEQMASYTGRWALMELQPGTVNWTGVPVHVYPGAIRLWIWTAYAHGAEFVTTYRYRQPRFGCELFHHGLVGTDGVTPSKGGQEFMQVIGEMKKLAPTSAKTQAKPSATQATVGLIYDHEQMYYYMTMPQAKRWNYKPVLLSLYAAIAKLGLRVKVLQPDGAWPSDLPLIIAPALQMVDETLVRRLDGYASAGGNLLLTCRSGLMDRTGQLWEGPTAKPLIPLIGATITGYDGLPEETWGKVEMNGKSHRWSIWADLLQPAPGTKVLATYTDQFYAGTAAITQATRGKGTVTYSGPFGEESLDEALIETLARQAGLPINKLPSNVHVLERDGYRIVLNYKDKPITAPAGESAKFLVGGRTVEPAGVAVWTE